LTLVTPTRGTALPGTENIPRNEAAAAATLYRLALAQDLMQSQTSIDQDLDGVGEFAYFAELTGSRQLRDSQGTQNGPFLDPPLLPVSYAVLSLGAVVQHAGYRFMICLPADSGAPVREYDFGGSPGGVSSNEAETHWIGYAWPVEFGVTGHRAFAVNQDAMVLYTDNLWGPQGPYSGVSNYPAGDAACTSPQDMTSALSVDGAPAPANDGNSWLPASTVLEIDPAPLVLSTSQDLYPTPLPTGQPFQLHTWGVGFSSPCILFLIAVDTTPLVRALPLSGFLDSQGIWSVTGAAIQAVALDLTFRTLSIDPDGKLQFSTHLTLALQ
jgi:hypothetical protein